jgi:hypothetical protein
LLTHYLARERGNFLILQDFRFAWMNFKGCCHTTSSCNRKLRCGIVNQALGTSLSATGQTAPCPCSAPETGPEKEKEDT